jgi:hypothetical protein
MTYLSLSQLNELSFPDTEILDFELDSLEKICKIFCLHGFLGKFLSGMILKRVMIEIKNYQSVEIIEFIESTNMIHEFNGEFALKDICEFILTDNSVTLKGFSKISVNSHPISEHDI